MQYQSSFCSNTTKTNKEFWKKTELLPTQIFLKPNVFIFDFACVMVHILLTKSRSEKFSPKFSKRKKWRMQKLGKGGSGCINDQSFIPKVWRTMIAPMYRHTAAQNTETYRPKFLKTGWCNWLEGQGWLH